ncbi:MAG: cytochrome c biogenesis protein CcsA [Saprospiraceae bacterium]
MNEIQYAGEHLWLGNLGHFLIVLAFVGSILSAIAYACNAKKTDFSNTWRSLGRLGYIIHGVSIFIVVGLLFYAMINKWYEYAYVYEHVSNDLPLKYTVSAFWEGQEGSFMLWMMWHIVLGFILIWKGGKWESPVMVTIATAEIFLNSMILGRYIGIGEWVTKIGASPMNLLRDTMQIPLFNNADYLSLISGSGLNPLLQNYWMTIHPPVTFLGFASTIVPFAFAVAGLWTGKYKEWLKPALPWALFSTAILGSGILMGAVWAYEALSFGGYWSWDPVENAVLVPWLTLLAGVHTHLVARSTGYSIKATILFYVISFPLIVYSTFLTRSGVLGDTSAHAFTEMGLEKQLIAFFMLFFIIGIGGLILRYKKIPAKPKEESLYSREFWMFIGALVLLFSAVLIGVPTSLPVYNSIMSSFDEHYIGQVIQDPVPFYNKYQLWIAILIGFLSGATVFLRYTEKNWKNRTKFFIKHIGISLLLASVFTYILTFWIDLVSWQYVLLSIAGLFTVFTNIDYIISVVKGNIKLSASAISHFGFGIMTIGLLSSGLNSSSISSSPFLFSEIFNKEDVLKYVQLIKGKELLAQGYWITYDSDTLVGNTRYYDITFKRKNANNEVIDEFKLRPNSVYSHDFSKVAAFNPDTKHYLHKDIFSCIVSLAPTKMDLSQAKAFEDTLAWKRYEVSIGDTLKTPENNWYVVNNVNFEPTVKDYDPKENDFGVEINVDAGNKEFDLAANLNTALGLKGALLYKYPAEKQDLGLRVRLADDFMDQIFTGEDKLEYKTFKLKTYGSFDFGGCEIKLTGFDREPEARNYIAEEGDMAVGAKMMVIKDGVSYPSSPIFFLRGNSPMGTKSYVPETGLHIRFMSIDPQKEEFTFMVAKDERNKNYTIPLEIAENVQRSDYVILQAQIFPGINLLWAGCSFMMLGLFMGMWRKK